MIDHVADCQRLAVMASNGLDLSKPVLIVHSLCFPSDEAAQVAAHELRKGGWETVTVALAPAPTKWKRVFGSREYSCIVESRIVPAESAIFAATDRMHALATALGGEYDGWDARAEP